MLPKRAYSVNETMAATGDSRAAFYKAVNDGRLKVRKNGRKTVVLAEDLQAYLDSLPVYQPRKAA